MHWTGLPFIRKELTKIMVHHFGLTQRETAGKMGLTPAAVCQYLHNKRSKINIRDAAILLEIRRSASEIINNGETSVHLETCRLCKMLREKGFF
jgi:predicted transcriptional regulator